MNNISEKKDHESHLKHALLALKKMRSRLEEVEQTRTEPIAIIGLGCRFPGGVNDPDSFWKLLSSGADAIREIPSNRWDINDLYDPNPDSIGEMNTKWAGMLEDVDKFDADFFGISPREAISMDPQQRILLEVGWEALENAGQTTESLAAGQTGVFVGVMTDDYGKLQRKNEDPGSTDVYTMTGSDIGSTAGRLSYILGLQGPSMAVCAGCASSLVTVHLACQSLRNQECKLALAGGVNLILSPEYSLYMSRVGALSSDGHCKTFDASANGYVRAEGCGVVVLKRLSDAVADSDNILAVIRGSAVNHNGRHNGYTTPNGLAQQALIRTALKNGGIEPSQVSYVEAHGTGTSLGDPIEVRALGTALGEGHSKERPLIIGSTKTNIGHLEPAAGVAGLIKVVLALKHREIPPHLHLKEKNPHITWEELPITIPTELTPWDAIDGRRIAGISAFSLFGTNAHVIVEEFQQISPVDQPEELAPEIAQILPISAKSPDALRALAELYRDYLMNEAGGSLEDVCYTAGARRAHHHHRLALAGRSRKELVQSLNAFLEGEPDSGASSGCRDNGSLQKVVFVFPGQGSQWFRMGRELLQQEPIFREAMEQCEKAMLEYVDWSLLKELKVDEAESRLKEIDVIQPTLFAIEVSLAALWRSWGIEPDAVVGHSMGEVAAAYVAGALKLEDAVRIICLRSRLLKRMSGKGGMASVEFTVEEARRALVGYEDRVSIAVSNSRRSTVLSGDTEALRELLETLEERGIFCRMVKVDVASHSPQMDPLKEDLLQALQGLHPQTSTIPIYSTVTAELSDGEEFDAGYWLKNLREPVLFSSAIERLATDDHNLYIEMSPHPILLPAIEQELHHIGKEGIALASMRREEDQRAVMLRGLGALYTNGYQVDWNRLYPKGGSILRLPNYPWRRISFWLEGRQNKSNGKEGHTIARRGEGSSRPLQGRYLRSSVHPGTHFWEMEVSAGKFSWLKDHRVMDTITFPATAYLETVMAATAEAFGEGPHVLESVKFDKALFLSEDGLKTVQLVINSETSESASFQFSSLQKRAGEEYHEWMHHASGTILLNRESIEDLSDSCVPEKIKDLGPKSILAANHYEATSERGIQYGPTFQGVEMIWRRDGEAIGKICFTEGVLTEEESFEIHPALLDACLQISLAALPETEAQTGITYLPVKLEKLQIFARLHSNIGIWSHAIIKSFGEKNSSELEADLLISDQSGRVLVKIDNLTLKRLENARQHPLDQLFYQIDWESKSRERQIQSGSFSTKEPGVWLIFADSGGIGQDLISSLEGRGEICIKILQGETYRALDNGVYYLDPTRVEDFQKLLNDVFENGRSTCRGLAHMWCLDAREAGETTLESLVSAQERYCGSVLHLIQALAKTGSGDLPRLWLMTGGVQPIGTEIESISIAQSPIWGLGKVITHEHSEFRCARVDLSHIPGQREIESLCNELLSDDDEDQITLRGNERYVARLANRPPKAEVKSAQHVLRGDATYLITGGLGGLGLTVARWMVNQGVRHLALAGRNGSSKNTEPALDEMRNAGAEILVVKADAADSVQVKEMLAQIDGSMPPLRGIIHAAGVLDDGILLQQDLQRFRHVMAPKIEGAWNVHSQTLDRELDLFVLFSSAASMLGTPGQGNYAAANSFLDALAHHRRAQGKPALSINWGAWLDVGLAAAESNRGERLALRGMSGITPEQGVEALGQLLDSQSVQTGVMALNLRQWRQSYPKIAGSPLFANLIRRQAVPVKAIKQEKISILEKLLALKQGPERRSLLESHIREQLKQVLRLTSSQLDSQTPMQSLGVDSLMALEMRNRLEVNLNLTLSATLIWTYPTIALLASHLAEKMGISLEQLEEIVEVQQEDDELPTILSKLEGLSEAETEALLFAKLADIDERRVV